jgi:hypothetical protein
MVLAVQIVVMLALGVACALIANTRGRSPVGWFFIGFLAGCIGLILVLVLPDLKVQEERERRLADENRRLRERLRKDRMVADERHGEISRRLGAHDVALGVDTGGAPVAALPTDAPSAPAPSTASPPNPASAELRGSSWFWAHGTNRQGPVDFGALQGLWREGRLTTETLVWRKGMSQWSPVRDVPLLADELDV